MSEDQVRSYASARYYHWKRDPPVDYLRQIAEVYDTPLEYLATGVGPATNEEKAGTPPSLSAAIEDLRGGLLETQALTRLSAVYEASEL